MLPLLPDDLAARKVQEPTQVTNSTFATTSRHCRQAALEAGHVLEVLSGDASDQPWEKSQALADVSAL